MQYSGQVLLQQSKSVSVNGCVNGFVCTFKLSNKLSKAKEDSFVRAIGTT